MTAYWPFWASGAALSAVALGHWFLVRRMFAVSGRYSAVVDRVRLGPAPADDMSEAEMLAAIRTVTATEFGADAVVDAPPLPEIAEPAKPASQSTSVHVLFLVCLAVGGALSARLTGDVRPSFQLASDVFPKVFGSGGWVAPAVLFTGGTLVGFGTRLAGGCTSGHGICGVSRGQRGSLVATAAFFGMGVALSLALTRLVQ